MYRANQVSGVNQAALSITLKTALYTQTTLTPMELRENMTLKYSDATISFNQQFVLFLSKEKDAL